jgi:hypothetical protein
VAHHGSPALVLLARPRGEAAFFAAMASGQIRTLRRRRADGSGYPALVDDLAFYLRHRRAWRRVAAALVAGAAAWPSMASVENEKPRQTEGGASIAVDIPSPDPGAGMISLLSG